MRTPNLLVLVAFLLSPATALAAPAPLGVTYSAWRGGFADAPTRIGVFKTEGFRIVSLVPAYAYVGLDAIDPATGPTTAELAAAIDTALGAGLSVVVKPHLEPLGHAPGYDRAKSENDSWRVESGWRGFFDLDPMTPSYREGVVGLALHALRDALARHPDAPPVRLELGAELMNSEVHKPERWLALLAAVKTERRRLGLDGRVLLSHNFTHHVEIPDDYVARMDAKGRRALARYIEGLDALALSQYMDLTAAVPAGARGTRLPTADEVAAALVRHERAFRDDVLVRRLGIRASRVPPLHLGELGVGSGGLRHPNLWGGTRTPAREVALAAEIARGHEGFARYLSLNAGGATGRLGGSAVLWVTGPHFDIFGWRNPAYGVPAAAAAIRGALRGANN